MSKTLRRPMFRGGPVDSRGTGITSGLDDSGYADGGRVSARTGAFISSLIPKSPFMMEGFKQATSAVGPAISKNIKYLNPFSLNPINLGIYGLGASSALGNMYEENLTDEEKIAKDEFIKESERLRGINREAGTSTGIMSRLGVTYEDAIQKQIEQSKKGQENIAKFEKAEVPGFFEGLFRGEKPVKELKQSLEDGKKSYLEQEKRDKEERDILEKRKNVKDTNEINIEDIEKESKLYQKLLGGEEAKQQSIYDALLAASPAFFKGRNLREAAPEVLTAINKSGAFDKPRDIKQAAAQLAIQRRMLVDKSAAEGRAKADLLSEKKPSTFSEAILQYGKGQEPTPYLVKTVAQMFTGEPPLDVPGAKTDGTGNLVNYKEDKLIPNKFYVSGSNLYMARYNPDGRLVLVKRG